MIRIRKFNEQDIPYKIEWVNDPSNNQYLHYNLPLTLEGTKKWYENIQARTDRYDATILYNDNPVGLIGLLNIDRMHSKAEYYILLGEKSMKGQGIAKEATKMILEKAFQDENLNRVFLYTEVLNVPAQNLFKRAGFKMEGTLREDIYRDCEFHDRYIMSVLKKDYERI